MNKKAKIAKAQVRSVEASAETIDELKVLLRKVGITLPSGEPEHDDMPREPMKIVKVDMPMHRKSIQ